MITTGSLSALLDGMQAVLFDLDGVLLDTEPLYTKATQMVLEPHGKTFEWETKSRMMGRSPLESAQTLIDAVGLQMTASEFLARKRPLLEDLFRQSQPMPGAADFVEHLARRNVRLAVATSSEHHFFDLKTSHHSWFRHIGTVVCGDDPAVAHLKPAPDIFLVAAERVGVLPEQCLVFEDSPAGVQAALAAGARVVALPDPHLDREGFRKAHYVIDSLLDLSRDASSY